MMTTNETKTERAERLKREKNPWEFRDEIRRFARDGYDSIPPEWLTTYFRWWGVYTQGDGAGAVGGAGGEGKSVPYFMLRIRVPNGLLRSHQLRTVAQMAELLHQREDGATLKKWISSVCWAFLGVVLFPLGVALFPVCLVFWWQEWREERHWLSHYRSILKS